MSEADILKEIVENLKARRSIFLVGPSNGGKTWFVKNQVIPFLERSKIGKIEYFPNPELLPDRAITNVDYVIVDEVESMQDRDRLEKNHPSENPYYSNEYEKRVLGWFKKLRYVEQPGVFIVSRNDGDAPYFLETVKIIYWNGDSF